MDRHIARLHHGKSAKRHVISLVWRYLLLVLVAIVMLGPFAWLLYLSVRVQGDIYAWPSSRHDFSFENYPYVWREFEVGQSFLNSTIVSVASVVLTVLVASLAAYPLARYDFYGKRLVFLAILSTLMVPFQLYMIPLYLLIAKTLNLGNTLTGVVLPFCVSVFGIYLIRQFYAAIPRDMEEAARVDGASELRLWWTVMCPLTKPAVATLAIFSFVGSWSNFLWPLIVLLDPEKFTLPVALSTLSGTFIDRIGYLAAGSVIAIAPVVLFFLLLQRWFLGGITVGAVKG